MPLACCEYGKNEIKKDLPLKGAKSSNPRYHPNLYSKALTQLLRPTYSVQPKAQK